MSNVFLEASEQLERELARVQGLAKIATELRNVGAIVQAANEAQARRDRLESECAARMAEIATAEMQSLARIDAARKDVERDKADAETMKADARKAIEAAKAESSAIVSEAQDAARAKLAQASSDIEATVAQNREIVAGAKRQAAVATARLEQIKGEVASAEAQRDAVVAEIQRLRLMLAPGN